MKRAGFVCLLLCVALVAGATADPQEVVLTDDPPLPSAEYVTGTPLPPGDTSAPPQKDPFKPYDIGDPASAIPYEALSPEERAVVDRGRDVAGWQQVHNAYATAARELGARAAADAAARQLGVDALDTQGVIP